MNCWLKRAIVRWLEPALREAGWQQAPSPEEMTQAIAGAYRSIVKFTSGQQPYDPRPPREPENQP